MKTLVSAFVVVSALVLFSCIDEADTFEAGFQEQIDKSNSLTESMYELPQSMELLDNCGTIIEKPLVSKDAFVAGRFFIANDSRELHLVFQAAEGWKVSGTPLYFGELEFIPSNSLGKATVSLGQFPYKNNYDPPLVEAPIISIALNKLPSDSHGNLIIVAHATVISGEEDLAAKSVYAEWVDELWFSGPQWGGGFIYSMQICDETMESASIIPTNAAEFFDPLLLEEMCIEPSQLNLIATTMMSLVRCIFPLTIHVSTWLSPMY